MPDGNGQRERKESLVSFREGARRGLRNQMALFLFSDEPVPLARSHRFQKSVDRGDGEWEGEGEGEGREGGQLDVYTPHQPF